jgi:hypothetical protein
MIYCQLVPVSGFNLPNQNWLNQHNPSHPIGWPN